jgi:tetratricopeptide (TPR) repeat protein
MSFQTASYQHYLKGRYFWNKRDAENLRKAIEQFKAAVDKDPNYALAFAGLADCYVVMPYYSAMQSSDSLPQAKEYATRASAIDEQLAEAHTSLAYVNQGLWNWAEAEKEYKRAIELNPNYATAHLWYARFQLRVLNRGDEGLARLKRALELEPLSLVVNDNLIQIYLVQGDVNSSMEQARRLIELDPNYWGGYYYLGYLHIKKGQNTEALAEAKRGVELS